MRENLVAGNWKMYGSLGSVGQLAEAVATGAGALEQVEVAIFPPFVFLPEVGKRLGATRVALGAQNVSEHDEGAHTGEITASMLLDLGCSYVIVGHSERRSLYGESDEMVARKFEQAQGTGLRPILCVGETLAQRESNETYDVIARQLDAVSGLVDVDTWHDAVIAYEPVWAIGTGRTATPEQANDVHEFIRRRVAERSADVAQEIRILYGGSVKPGNAAGLFDMSHIDGGLVGGASLLAEEFLAICRAASR